jgi:hypothetical protein
VGFVLCSKHMHMGCLSCRKRMYARCSGAGRVHALKIGFLSRASQQ